jgi:hypothetical protein
LEPRKESSSRLSDIFKPINLPNPPNLSVLGAAVSGISPSGNTVGVVGESVGQSGVWGTSKTGDGVDGTSDSGAGVSGTSSTGIGVKASSTGGDGVWAEGGDNGVYGKTSNDSASGVYGINYGKGPGVAAASQYGPSLSATGYNGNLAGQFDGNVDVTGDLKGATLSATGLLTAGSITASGDITALDVKLSGGDIAEDFTGTGADLEPGTVMVISDEGALSRSTTAYDRRVAGVVSGAGDLKPGVVLDRRKGMQDRVQVAMLGKVYCKVDALYGPIAVGDMLTTSLTPGHAMKASDPAQAFGSVIGKALRRLDSGSGLIPILVALQ